MERRPYGWMGAFQCMASPCEVHIVDSSLECARTLVDCVAAEAWRIEEKFSRYRDGNIVDRINNANGRPVTVDEETARLLTYAGELFELSGGRFDVTSGVLRRAWKFDGGSKIPSSAAVRKLMNLVGWARVRWRSPELRMPAGMQIDLGGIGKEYAVDQAGRIAAGSRSDFMINFGGDLVARGQGPDGNGWVVGIEGIGLDRAAGRRIRLQNGGIATSGDAYRYVERNGKRFGHVLDARTGWPVERAPRSVTVAGPSCTFAGMLATFAMLYGDGAEKFLAAQGVRYVCLR